MDVPRNPYPTKEKQQKTINDEKTEKKQNFERYRSLQKGIQWLAFLQYHIHM
jgi:hypothetical protein